MKIIKALLEKSGMAENTGIGKKEFPDRLKESYENHHGKNSLWFSGKTNKEQGESNTRFIARRYAQSIASLILVDKAEEAVNKFLKGNALPFIFLATLVGFAIGTGILMLGGVMSTVIMAVAAIILGASSTLVAAIANAPIMRVLTAPTLTKSEFQRIAKTVSLAFIREKAIDAPDDLKDLYRLPFLDKNGNPISDRIYENDLQEDYYASGILKNSERAKLTVVCAIMLSAFVGTIMALVVAPIYLGLEFVVSLDMLIAVGTFTTLYTIMGALAVLAYGKYAGVTASLSGLSQRNVILEALANASPDQLALQSGVAGAIIQEDRARDDQIEIAKKDNTPFFQLGQSTGFLFQRYDQFAPSTEGMPVGLTFNDLSTHLLILGGTGAGKTSGTIRPLIKQWLSNDQGGLLVLDGKGQLPSEIISANYTLLTPTSVTINPIEGLKPDDVAETLENLHNDGSSSNDPYWNNAASKLIRSTAHAVQALAKKDVLDYNLSSIYNLLSNPELQAQARKELDNEFMNGLSGAAKRGINYALVEFPAMPEKQRGSIEGIASLWLSQITDNEELSDWADAKEGYEIEKVVKGARVGVLLPEARYGKAGVLVSGLLKKRVYEAIKRRGDQWHKERDQTAVLVVIDEVQELLTDDETNMLPIARSLGLYATFSTQNIDGILKKLGEHAGYQLLGNLRSLVAFQTQTEKTTSYISERMGSSYRPQIAQGSMYADTYARMQKISNSGVNSEYSDNLSFTGTIKTIGSKLVDAPAQALQLLVNPEKRNRKPEQTLSGQPGSPEWDYKGMRFNQDVDYASNIENYDRLNQSIALIRNVTADEVNEVLSQPNTALCQVIRGRVIRRDLIITKPIYEMGESA